ncbi:MAG: START-like domain-containing protein [Cytophagales bacterium]|nr:START-like domain-containing protein [Cytophagales bacterium]
MAKNKFIGEYDFRASKKMLYPYISTASGLSQWFADDVNVNNEDKVYTIIWDGEENKAKMVSSRANHHVKFEFLDTETDEDDVNYVEMKFDVSEMTQELFLRVTDFSDMDDEEASELWDSLIHDLKEIVGG